MRSRRVAVGWLVGLLFLLAGPPAARGTEVPDDADETGAAADGSLDGAALYRRHCAVCHGPTARGDGPDAPFYDPPPPNLRSGVVAKSDTAALVERIREGTPLALDQSALGRRARETEAIVAHLERLPAVDWRLVDAGTEVYIDRCEACHGPYGRPPEVLPPGVGRPRDLSDPAWQRGLTATETRDVVRHGRAGMPAIVPRLEEADIGPLVAFVRLLSPGYELYSRYCAACHGEDGRGGDAVVEGMRSPTVVFDERYLAAHDAEVIRSSVWHMVADRKPQMPHLRNVLGTAEARAIVEHLKKPAP